MTYIDGSTATPKAIEAAASTQTPGPGVDGIKIDAAEVKRRWEDGKKALRRLVGHYQENVAFDSGHQWVYWDRAQNRLSEFPRKDDRVRATVNRLLPARRIVMAKLHRRPLVFDVTPSASDDTAVQAAKLAETVISDCAREQDWETLRAKADLSSWLGGCAILSIEWDPGAGTPLGVTETGMTYGTGDVRVASSSIAQVAFPQGITDAAKAQWWIRAAIMPTAEAKERFNMPAEPNPDASANPDVVRSSRTEAQSETPTPENACMVLSYFERPSAKNPSGAICTVIGNSIVQGPYPWYFPWRDKLNVAIIREAPIEDHWAGETVVSAAVQLQVLLNLTVSSIAEHGKLAGNARLVMSDQSMELIETLTDQVGEVIPVAPTDGIQPHWIAPPDLPQWMMEQVRSIEKQIDDILGWQEISRGSTPSNIQSGLGLSILAEQADTPITSMAVAAGRAWGQIGTMTLRLYERFVIEGEQRTARIEAPGMRAWTVPWSGKDLAGQTVATVPAEAVTPRSRAAQQAAGIRMWELKIITDPRVLAQIADLPDQADFVEAIEPDVARAERENHDMSVGKASEVKDFDDHVKHIDVHNRFRKTLRYEQMDPQSQQMVDEHVLAHEGMARSEAARQAMSPPEMSGVPQADQPVGSPGGPPATAGFALPPGPDQGGPPTPTDTGTPPSEPLGPAGQQMLNPSQPSPPAPSEVMAP